MEIRSYRDLKVWQLGMELVSEVYEGTRSFPKAEVFALTNQVQRAAVSIPSNIAEGHARGGTREFLHFITIALGSLAETETQLLVAHRLRYVDNEALSSLMKRCDEVGKMLRALQKALKAKELGQ